jgi:AcrR family transcriptional regulator
MPVPRGSTLDPQRTRAAILRSATDLLYERGLDGIGVTELCARLSISKETLYRHFGSRDRLVEAVLEARSDRVVAWLREAVRTAGDSPEDQLVAVFDALERWYIQPSFRGCGIVNAAVQRHDGAARSIVARHLDRHLDLLAGIAEHAGVADPETVGRQLLMLLEGATVVADHHGVDGTGQQAQAAALHLLRTASPTRRRRSTR